MIKEVFLHEEFLEAGKVHYRVIRANDRYVEPGLPIEIREPKIFLFNFHREIDTRFTVACYTLDEALSVFANMYKNVEEFTVTIKS